MSERGKAEAAALPTRLEAFPVTAIYSSPLERAAETAAPLAAILGQTVALREGLKEIHFGGFAGRTMQELDDDPLWRDFNVRRSVVRPPGGEMMLETQARMVAELERIRAAHRDQTVAVFSHGDVIRSAVLHYLGMPLDFYDRIVIDPASVTVLEFHGGAAQVTRLNLV